MEENNRKLQIEVKTQDLATHEELRTETKILEREIEILETKITRINAEMHQRIWWLVVAMYILTLSIALLAILVIRG